MPGEQLKISPVAYPKNAPPGQYGLDNDALAAILKQYEGSTPVIELVEVFSPGNPIIDLPSISVLITTDSVRITRQTITDVPVLQAHLDKEVYTQSCLLKCIWTAYIRLQGTR